MQEKNKINSEADESHLYIYPSCSHRPSRDWLGALAWLGVSVAHPSHNVTFLHAAMPVVSAGQKYPATNRHQRGTPKTHVFPGPHPLSHADILLIGVIPIHTIAKRRGGRLAD